MESYFYIFYTMNAALVLIQIWCFLCSQKYVLYTQKAKKTYPNWG